MRPDRPWFLWDVDVSASELRQRLHDPDPRIRAQWQGRVLREATYNEVWDYVTLPEVVQDWSLIHQHLGRRREFWEFLLRGWREDGFLPA